MSTWCRLKSSCCCRCFSSRPAEVGSVAPHAVQDHGKTSRQRHNRLLKAPPLGNIHGPGLQPRPFRHSRQQNLRRFIEQASQHGVPAQRDVSYPFALSGLIEQRRQPKHGPHGPRPPRCPSVNAQRRPAAPPPATSVPCPAFSGVFTVVFTIDSSKLELEAAAERQRVSRRNERPDTEIGRYRAIVHVADVLVEDVSGITVVLHPGIGVQQTVPFCRVVFCTSK